jgi:hypothetical protein
MATALQARRARAARRFIVILPAALLAASIYAYSVDVPYKDQWDIAHFFVEYERGTLSAADLFAQFNEYRQFFPNLLFVALGELTSWRVQFELAVSFLLACVVFANVALLGRRTVTVSDDVRLGATFVAAVLVFSPVQYENWLWGIQVVYFVPVACVTTGILVAYSDLGTVAKFALGASLCVISTFSSANGILAWLLLLPVFLVLLRTTHSAWRRFAGAWAALAAVSTALYFYGYESPAGHPSLTEALTSPFHAAVYVVGFLGSPFGVRGGDVVAGLTAGVAGALAAAGFLASCAYVWKFRSDRALAERTIGWIALGAYSLATGLAVAIGRVGFGVGQSLASRYATFSLYLSVALAFLALIVLEHLRLRHAAPPRNAWSTRVAIGTAVALAASQIPVYAFGFRSMDDLSEQQLRGKACLRSINVAPDHVCLVENMYPDVTLLRRRANELDALGFLRPRLARTRTP